MWTSMFCDYIGRPEHLGWCVSPVGVRNFNVWGCLFSFRTQRAVLTLQLCVISKGELRSCPQMIDQGGADKCGRGEARAQSLGVRHGWLRLGGSVDCQRSEWDRWAGGPEPGAADEWQLSPGENPGTLLMSHPLFEPLTNGPVHKFHQGCWHYGSGLSTASRSANASFLFGTCGAINGCWQLCHHLTPLPSDGGSELLLCSSSSSHLINIVVIHFTSARTNKRAAECQREQRVSHGLPWVM